MCDCGKTGLGQWAATVGGQAGDALTNYGYGLMEKGKKRFKSWTGFGDYKLVANSLVNGAATPHVNVTTNNRMTRIQYREYLGDIYTSEASLGAFNVVSYDIQPANPATFPWLAPIAQQYEQYKPMGILFEFQSTATDNVTAASVGSIVMMTDYDVLDSVPTSKSEMLNSAYAQESKMSDSQVHGVECDPAELQRNVFYTRNTSLTSSTAGPRDYNVGRFHIATYGGSLPIANSVGSSTFTTTLSSSSPTSPGNSPGEASTPNTR